MAQALLAVVLCLGLVAPAVAGAPIVRPAAAQTKPAKPDWNDLTAAQQAILAPLKDDWSEFDTNRRKKWVQVADKYPKMKGDEQTRVQARMREWVQLTPEQRRLAREKYRTITKLSPEKKAQLAAQWQRYQQSIAVKSEDAPPEPGAAEGAQ